MRPEDLIIEELIRRRERETPRWEPEPLHVPLPMYDPKDRRRRPEPDEAPHEERSPGVLIIQL